MMLVVIAYRILVSKSAVGMPCRDLLLLPTAEVKLQGSPRASGLFNVRFSASKLSKHCAHRSKLNVLDLDRAMILPCTILRIPHFVWRCLWGMFATIHVYRRKADDIVTSVQEAFVMWRSELWSTLSARLCELVLVHARARAIVRSGGR